MTAIIGNTSIGAIVRMMMVTSFVVWSLWACSWGGDAADRDWGSSRIVSTGSGDALAPQAAADSSGNVHAVWYQDNGIGATNIWASRYLPAFNVWTTPQLIQTGTTEALSPKVVTCGNGNAFAVWYQNYSFGSYRIWGNRYSAATGNWESAQLIQTGLWNALDPQLAADGQGNVYALWYQDNGEGIYNIQAARYRADTGTWGAPLTIQTDPTVDALYANLSANAAGDVVAAWAQDDGTGVYNIWANRSASGSGQWGTARKIQSGDGDAAVFPAVAVDAAGNAMAVWNQDSGTDNKYTIRANRYDCGSGQWGLAQVIQAGTNDAVSPRIAADGRGNFWVVWIEDNGTGAYNLRAARYRTNTGTWGIPQTIQAVNDDASDPQLSVDFHGNVIVLWSQNSSDGSSSGVIWSNRYRAHAGAWGRARIVQSQNGIARTPQVAVTPTAKTATALWSQAGDTATYSIWAGSYQ
jgi:hypothetical protein